jgi:hypothetical protein
MSMGFAEAGVKAVAVGFHGVLLLHQQRGIVDVGAALAAVAA